MDWINEVIALASLLVAALAWIAKILWSREFAAAKDETIRAKDEIIRVKEEQLKVAHQQMASLAEMNPMRIREYFLSLKEQLEEYNEYLHAELAKTRQELEEKQADIIRLRARFDAERMMEPRIEKQAITYRDEHAAELSLDEIRFVGEEKAIRMDVYVAERHVERLEEAIESVKSLTSRVVRDVPVIAFGSSALAGTEDSEQSRPADAGKPRG